MHEATKNDAGRYFDLSMVLVETLMLHPHPWRFFSTGRPLKSTVVLLLRMGEMLQRFRAVQLQPDEKFMLILKGTVGCFI